jgi:hypothetical protein
MQADMERYKNAMISMELSLSGMIESWKKKKPLKPFMDEGTKALEELKSLREKGIFVIISEEGHNAR